MSLVSFTPGYIQLFSSMTIDSNRLGEIDGIVRQIVAHQDRYEAVEKVSTVPWYVIAFIHNLECSLRFDEHLHNGDPLRHKTVDDPAGRPPGWDGTGTWEESALDALQYDKLTRVSAWDLPRICYEFELFNGFGYRSQGINSPYLWAGCQHYTQGKFIADHDYSPTAVSDEIGTIVLLKRMLDQGTIALRAAPVDAESAAPAG